MTKSTLATPMETSACPITVNPSPPPSSFLPVSSLYDSYENQCPLS